MSQGTALFLAPLLLAGGGAPAGSSSAPITSAEAGQAAALIRTFQDRCLSAPKTVEGFKAALAGTQRTPEFDQAFADAAARRTRRGPRLFYAAGFLSEPIDVALRVEAFGPTDIASEVMTCEVIWRGAFPESLPAALAARIGQPARGPIASQGAQVYELTERPRDQWNRADLDVTMVSNKPPLHSIVRLVSRPLAATGK